MATVIQYFAVHMRSIRQRERWSETHTFTDGVNREIQVVVGPLQISQWWNLRVYQRKVMRCEVCSPNAADLTLESLPPASACWMRLLISRSTVSSSCHQTWQPLQWCHMSNRYISTCNLLLMLNQAETAKAALRNLQFRFLVCMNQLATSYEMWNRFKRIWVQARSWRMCCTSDNILVLGNDLFALHHL